MMRKSVSHYLPLKSLTGYTPRWCVLVRVTEVAPLVTFARKANVQRRRSWDGGSQVDAGGGKILSATIVDKEGTSMQCKFWNENAAKYEKIIQKGQIYSMRGGSIRTADKKYSRSSDGAYEIHFSDSCEIIPMEDLGANDGDEAKLIPEKTKYHFSIIKMLTTSFKAPPVTLDVLGVVLSADETRSLVSQKSGDTLTKRDIAVGDSSWTRMNITLWNDLATQHSTDEFQRGCLVALRNVNAREWRGGISGSSLPSSDLLLIDVSQIDDAEDERVPDFAKDLFRWYRAEKDSIIFTDISQVTEAGFGATQGGSQAPVEHGTLSDLPRLFEKLKNDPEGANDSVVIYVNAQISKCLYRNQRSGDVFAGMYKACTKCNRKMGGPNAGDAARDEQSLADFSAEQCAHCGTSVTPTPRFNFLVHLIDHTGGEVLARIFHESAMVLLGRECQPLNICKWVTESATSEDEETAKAATIKIQEIFEWSMCWKKWRFLLRLKMDEYNGQARESVSIQHVYPIVHIEDAKAALIQVEKAVPNVTSFQRSRKRVETSSPVDSETDEMHRAKVVCQSAEVRGKGGEPAKEDEGGVQEDSGNENENEMPRENMTRNECVV